jgi:hypothetical protein
VAPGGMQGSVKGGVGVATEISGEERLVVICFTLRTSQRKSRRARVTFCKEVLVGR